MRVWQGRLTHGLLVSFWLYFQLNSVWSVTGWHWLPFFRMKKKDFNVFQRDHQMEWSAAKFSLSCRAQWLKTGLCLEEPVDEAVCDWLHIASPCKAGQSLSKPEMLSYTGSFRDIWLHPFYELWDLTEMRRRIQSQQDTSSSVCPV